QRFGDRRIGNVSLECVELASRVACSLQCPSALEVVDQRRFADTRAARNEDELRSAASDTLERCSQLLLCLATPVDLVGHHHARWQPSSVFPGRIRAMICASGTTFGHLDPASGHGPNRRSRITILVAGSKATSRGTLDVHPFVVGTSVASKLQLMARESVAS